MGIPPIRYRYSREFDRPVVINSYTGTVPYSPYNQNLKPYPNANNEQMRFNQPTAEKLIDQANEIRNRQFKPVNTQSTKTVSFGLTTTLNGEKS